MCIEGSFAIFIGFLRELISKSGSLLLLFMLLLFSLGSQNSFVSLLCDDLLKSGFSWLILEIDTAWESSQFGTSSAVSKGPLEPSEEYSSSVDDLLLEFSTISGSLFDPSFSCFSSSLLLG